MERGFSRTVYLSTYFFYFWNFLFCIFVALCLIINIQFKATDSTQFNLDRTIG